MPWSPNLRAPRDPRLDRYRDQVASLTRNGDVVGHVIFLTEASSMLLGGHLWWRRWSVTREVLAPRIELIDGSSYEPFMDEPVVKQGLELWSKNQFALDGAVFDLSWLPNEEAATVVPAVFGLDGCLDNDGRPIWASPSPNRP